MTSEAINIDHTNALISTTNDPFFYKKVNGVWESIKAKIYKSEFEEIPNDSLGNIGDYFATYFRRYNYVPYSEDFNTENDNKIKTKIWDKYKVILTKDPTLYFPGNSNPYKLKSDKTNSKHYMSYDFQCDKNKPLTFSLYVKYNDFHKLKITIGNSSDEIGVCNTVDLLNNTFSLSTYGDNTRIQDLNGTCELYDSLEKVYRISISGTIIDCINVKASIKMLNNEGEETFEPVDNKKGLFINGVQISKNGSIESYLKTTEKPATALSFVNLWEKLSPNNSHPISTYPTGFWNLTTNYLYQLSEKPNDNLGSSGDIATVDAMLTLKPFIIFGNAKYHITSPVKDENNSVIIIDKDFSPKIETKTVDLIKNKNDRGTLFYSKKNDAWYIRTKKGNCRLMLKNPKPNYHDMLISLTLGQQTYTTYNRGAKMCFRHGRNLAGCMNNFRTKNWF